MARRSWHPSANTRTEILDEAERQLQAVGYADMTIGSIAKALGMSAANIFKNFGNKAGLVDAMALRWLMEVDDSLDTTADIVPASSRLRAMLHLILENHLRSNHRPPHVEIMLAMNFEPPPSGIAFFQRLLRRVETLIRDGIHDGEFSDCDAVVAAETTCDCLISILDPASILRARHLFTPEQMTKKCDHLLDFVIKGLRASA